MVLILRYHNKSMRKMVNLQYKVTKIQNISTKVNMIVMIIKTLITITILPHELLLNTSNPFTGNTSAPLLLHLAARSSEPFLPQELGLSSLLTPLMRLLRFIIIYKMPGLPWHSCMPRCPTRYDPPCTNPLPRVKLTYYVPPMLPHEG